MYDDFEINGPKYHLKKLLEQLALDEKTMELVRQDCEDAGAAFDATYIRKEWINEVLSERTDTSFRDAALADPNGHFLSYGMEVLANPFKAPDRHIEYLQDRYGFAATAVFNEMRWPSEIAWAKRLRNHSDDETASAAALFLFLLGNAPSKAFKNLAEFAMSSAEPFVMSPTDTSVMAPGEIAEADITRMSDEPLCIQFAKATKTHIGMTPGVKRKHAEKARAAFREDNRTFRVETNLNYLKQYPLTMRQMVIFEAVRAGMSSFRLVNLYRSFLDSLYQMQEDMPDRSNLEDAFIKFLKASDGNAVRERTDFARKEVERDLAEVTSHWINRLPDAAQSLGASDKSKLKKWRSAVLSGERGYPCDLRVDYFMFLQSLA